MLTLSRGRVGAAEARRSKQHISKSAIKGERLVSLTAARRKRFKKSDLRSQGKAIFRAGLTHRMLALTLLLVNAS